MSADTTGPDPSCSVEVSPTAGSFDAFEVQPAACDHADGCTSVADWYGCDASDKIIARFCDRHANEADGDPNGVVRWIEVRGSEPRSVAPRRWRKVQP